MRRWLWEWWPLFGVAVLLASMVAFVKYGGQ